MEIVDERAHRILWDQRAEVIRRLNVDKVFSLDEPRYRVTMGVTGDCSMRISYNQLQSLRMALDVILDQLPLSV